MRVSQEYEQGIGNYSWFFEINSIPIRDVKK
jgi:hypothetical protein